LSFPAAGPVLAGGQRPPRLLAHLVFVPAAVRSGPYSEF